MPYSAAMDEIRQTTPFLSARRNAAESKASEAKGVVRSVLIRMVAHCSSSISSPKLLHGGSKIDSGNGGIYVWNVSELAD